MPEVDAGIDGEVRREGSGVLVVGVLGILLVPTGGRPPKARAAAARCARLCNWFGFGGGLESGVNTGGAVSSCIDASTSTDAAEKLRVCRIFPVY